MRNDCCYDNACFYAVTALYMCLFLAFPFYTYCTLTAMLCVGMRFCFAFEDFCDFKMVLRKI